MKKQYRCTYYSWWQTCVHTYCNGALIETKKLPIDEVEKEVERLEANGFTYGYIQEEVEEAKKKYEEKLANIIQ